MQVMSFTTLRLVESKDKEAVANMDKIMTLFRENLKHKDTYVYLQSVKGLAACANHDPVTVIDDLSRQFSLSAMSNTDETAEVQAKLGEAMVQVTKGLGRQMAPAHRERLLNPVLNQLSHPDDMVRASALSNLAEICKNLGFGLGGVVQEVLSCLDNAVTFDRSLQVRRAAVVVLVMLLEGLGQDTLRVLQAAIRDIWRSLTRLRNSETDEVMLHHVAKAIGIIDKVVMDFFQPSPQLKKTIYVLDTPPSPF